MKLLDEGVDVWRPVLAESATDTNSLLILAPPINSVPTGEDWEFEPGFRVLTKEMKLEGNLVKVAYKKIG